MITFETKILRAGTWNIIVLPLEASAKLPSRGMVMIKGTLNGSPLQTSLEPDGKKSHWFKIEDDLLKAAKAKLGDTVKLEIEAVKDWPEPKIPKDLKDALKSDSKAEEIWTDITPMARWDWIRWIQSTKNADTRKKRIDVTLSKFNKGNRRPCCFNRTECTIPEVSQKGVLMI